MARLAYLLILFFLWSCNNFTKESFLATGELYIVNKKGESFHRYDLSTHEITGRIGSVGEPHEIDISYDQSYIAVTNYKGSSLTILELNKDSVKHLEFENNAMPHGILFLNESTLLCTAEGTDELLMVNAQKPEVIDRISTNGYPAHMLARKEHRSSLIYLSNKEPGMILEVDLAKDSITRKLPMPGNVEGIDVNRFANELWVTQRDLNQVSVIDLERFEVKKVIPTDKFPIRIKFDPETFDAFVVNSRGNSIQIFDHQTYELERRIDFKTKPAWLFDLLNKTPIPLGIIFHRDQRLLYVATSNADKIRIIDLETWEFIGSIPTEDLPDGLVIRYK